MRVATKTIYSNIIKYINNATEAMTKANEVAASGKRINRLSDDPVGLVTVLDLNSSLANIEQMESNIDMGVSWLTAGEAALTQVEDLVTEAKTLCVEMASDTSDSSARANAVETVDGYLREILSLANTQVGGRYIFGGTQTDTAPFAFDDEDAPTAVNYAGNNSPFTIKVGKDTSVAVGGDGEEIFGVSGDSIFDTLIELGADLKTNNVDGIQEAMDKLDAHFETVQASISDIGAKQNRLDLKKNIIQSLELTYTDRKSQIEDADIAEAVINLESAELVYQAVLNSASQVMSLSLLDYI
jgi:flagellar hook-associated protein 3 FlgL